MSQSGRISKYFGAVSGKGNNVSIQSGSGALGAISLSNKVSVIRTTGASTGTLAAGVVGKEKHIVVGAHAGDYVNTVTGGVGFTTLTFTAAGSSASLVYTPNGWVITASRNVTVA